MKIFWVNSRVEQQSHGKCAHENPNPWTAPCLFAVNEGLRVCQISFAAAYCQSFCRPGSMLYCGMRNCLLSKCFPQSPRIRRSAITMVIANHLPTKRMCFVQSFCWPHLGWATVAFSLAGPSGWRWRERYMSHQYSTSAEKSRGQKNQVRGQKNRLPMTESPHFSPLPRWDRLGNRFSRVAAMAQAQTCVGRPQLL